MLFSFFEENSEFWVIGKVLCGVIGMCVCYWVDW